MRNSQNPNQSARPSRLGFEDSLLRNWRQGIDFAVKRQHIDFAVEVLREAGDVLWLFEESGAIRELAIFIAQAPNRSQSEVGVEIDALQCGIFLSAINVPASDAGANAVFGKPAFLRQGRIMRVFDNGIDIFRALRPG